MKAALILNITRFVEWPVTAFGSPSAPMIVAIAGQDEVSDVLEPMLAGKTVNGHPVQVRHVVTPDDIRACHVLYVARSERRRIDSVLKPLHTASILKVADMEHFAERGGDINFVIEDRRVHIVVNPSNAGDAHLKISSRLLTLAQIVGGTP